MIRRSATLLAFAAFGLAGCETTNLAPHAGPAARLDDDERRLWARAREEQDRLDRSSLRTSEHDTEAYLERVVARLHPDPVPGGGAFRVRVLIDPTFNAFAMPDGAIYVHSGLLTQAENEAQIATVLSHELTHTLHRHSVRGARQMRNQTAALATLGAGGMAAGLAGSAVTLLGAVGTVASVTGYSRELERDADTAGFQRLVAAGYEPAEAPKVFRILLAEAEREKVNAPFFFSTHPRLQERVASYDQLVAALPADRAPGTVGPALFEAAIFPLLLPNAQAALASGRHAVVVDNARRLLAVRPGDPHMTFLLAESHRKRAAKGDEETALRLLQENAQKHPGFPATHRSLGLIQMRTAPIEAAASFRRYLDALPDAPDRGYILDFIRQCETRS